MSGCSATAAMMARVRAAWTSALTAIRVCNRTIVTALRRFWTVVHDLKSILPETVAILGLVALLWSSIGILLTRERQHAIDAAMNTTAVLAKAFEEGTKRIITEVDQTLLSARTSYVLEGDNFDIQKWAKTMVRSDDLRVQIALMDRDGNQVKSTLARSNLRTVNIADRPHFRAQLDPSHDDLYISNPVVGRGSGAQTIQFTRKVLDSDGNFDGIAVLSLGCAELSSFYDTSEVGDGFVSLLTSEGVLLARGPSEPGIIGKSVAGEPDFQSLLKNSSGSLWWRNSSGSKRIISYRHVRGYPLLVEVAFNNDRIFRQYWYSVEHYVVTGLVATTVILLIGGFWVQQRRRTLVSGRALSLTLANMSQGIALIDARGSLPVINDHALKLLNMPTKDRASEAGGQAAVRRIRDLINSSSEGAYVADDKSAAQDAVIASVQEDGRVIEIGRTMLPDGGAIHTLTDVTERHRAEERIRYLAHNDSLTGLPNRVLLDEKVGQVLERATAEDTQVLTLFIDLDGFKGVNDTLGHLLGDRLLTHVAEQIRAVLGRSDFVARLGGDEFVILRSSVADVSSGIDLAHLLIERISAPVNLSGHEIRISASIGISVFPRDGNNKEALFRKADIALYRAKAEGRSRCVVFETGMDEALQRRILLEDDLRRAIEAGSLQVHYQPQFDCTRLKLAGFEALVRWNDPQRGWVPPSVFIPIAEECGLIARIGTWVLEQACQEAAQWPDTCHVAVNVSPLQLRDPAFASTVQEILQRTALSPHRLELEITESVMSDDSETTITTMGVLRALGVSFALDDFGTGYSSLSNLLRFQFDKVKIDKSFVQAQIKDTEARAIVEAIVVMSRHLGLMITAEGVETQEQLLLLRQQGCPQVQGHLLGMPMAGWQVPGLLMDRRADNEVQVLLRA
jgi:diguanylate cyclase (GGDEF)-like protein